MNLKNPIALSLIGLISITLVCVILFSTSKPDFVTSVSDDSNGKKVVWGKVISVSVVLGSLAGIVLYLSTMKKVIVVPSNPQPNVSAVVANAY